MTDMIFISDGKPVTTSRKVAECFSKRHRHVVEKIKAIECSDQFLTANFSLVKYQHRGNEYDAYEMTKDGFMFLVMGFTGKKAAAIKEKYISAFNAMAAQLAASAQPGASINEAQAHQIQTIVSAIAMQYPEAERGSQFSRIYGTLKKAFRVTKYRLIPASKYDDALMMLQAMADGKTTPELPSPVMPQDSGQSIDADPVHEITLPTPHAAEVHVSYLLNPAGCGLSTLLTELRRSCEQNQPVKINSVELAFQEFIAMQSLLNQQDKALSVARDVLAATPYVSLGCFK